MRMSCSRSSFTSLLVLGNARSALAPTYKTGAVGVREDHYLSRHCGGIESSDSEQHLCVFVRACTIVPIRSVGYTTKQAIWNNNASENNRSILFRNIFNKMNMNNSKKELHNRVLKELECPVCMEQMVPPIKLCRNGHNLCCNCRITMENCPICRGPFLQVRNLSLESLIPETMYPCKNSDKGCTGLFNKTELKSHEAKCSHGSYKCPFAMISNLDCDWYGSLTMMKDHIEQCHGDKRIQYVSKKFKTVLHNVEKSQRFYQAIITLGEVFYVKWRLYKGSFHCAVFYVGPHERASEFKYRFAISTNDGETVSGCSRTHSFLENVESIFRNGKCIMISQAILQRSYTDNGHLPIRMEISKVVNNNIANSNVNMNKLAMI